MRADSAAFSDLIPRCSVCGRAIVAVIGHCESRCRLDTAVGAVATIREVWIVRAIDRRRHGEGRQIPTAAQCVQSGLVAHSVVDAEVDITCIDLADLEPVIDADRRALGGFASEREAGAVAAIDVDLVGADLTRSSPAL